MRILSTFGQLPKTGLNLSLILVSALLEGFGLSLFIPLLHVLGGEESSALPPYISKFLESISDAGFIPNTINLLVLISALSIFALCFDYLQSKILIQTKNSYVFNLRNRVIGSFLAAKWRYSTQRPHGEVVSQITIECQRAGQALSSEVMAVATMILIVSSLIFSTVIYWKLTIMALVFGVFLFLVVLPFSRRADTLGKLTTRINKELSILVVEYLRALKLLKSTGNENIASKAVNQKNDESRECNSESELNGKKVYLVTRALPVLFLTFVIAISHEILNIPLSVTLVFVLFMLRIAPRAALVQQQLQTYYLHSPALLTVNELLKNARVEQEDLNVGGKIFKKLGNAISFDSVSFSYPAEKIPAIRGVNIRIKKNQIVGIVGSSGAGKTTIIDLITGLHKPDAGVIRIDGIDLKKVNLESWRQKLGLVTQETVTFNSSVRDNVKLFNGDASEVDIENAIEAANLSGMTASLSDGMDTGLGESGARFSGGQRQRIALARAFLIKPELLLLDEATSALDNETERFVQDFIRGGAGGKTVLIIAHRLSTVRWADKIYVMEKGQIIEEGSYSELIALGGRFAELVMFEKSPN